MSSASWNAPPCLDGKRHQWHASIARSMRQLDGWTDYCLRCNAKRITVGSKVTYERGDGPSAPGYHGRG